MLRKEKRVNGMGWVFRWSEEVNGRRLPELDPAEIS
jgi:hypothetical protein